MSNIFFVAIAVISISIGLFVIWVTYKLHKKYQLNYLSTYLYFQIFFFVFGVYGILGKEIAQKILRQQDSVDRSIESFGHFFVFLGIPFLLFAWYMFVRLCHEIIDQKISWDMSLVIFFVLGFVFTAYGTIIGLLNLVEVGDTQFKLLSKISGFLYVFLEVFVIFMALTRIFINSPKISDKNKRVALQSFASLNLVGLGAGIILFLFLNQHRTFGILYLFVFFVRNIPPLLSWRAYLRRHFVASALPATGEAVWQRFVNRYKISKREEEVVRLICDGKTNKEISEILYISLQTVKDHVYRIFQKTDVKNRVLLINLVLGTKENGR